MSLEIAIAENTAALREVAALLLKLGAMPGPGVSTPADVPPKAAKAPTPAPVPAEPPPAEEPPAELTYAHVTRALTSLMKGKGHAAVVALLREFKAEKGPDIKPEQYAAVCLRVTEMLS